MNTAAAHFATDPVLVTARRLDKPNVRMLPKSLVLRLLRHAVRQEVEVRELRLEVAVLREALHETKKT